MTTLNKDPDARLDYKWDWSDWLDADETIVDQVVVAASCTVETPTRTDSDKSVVAWISGGTLGTVVYAVCHIISSKDREDDRTIILNITNR